MNAPPLDREASLFIALADVLRERRRQDRLHPFVGLPDGTGSEGTEHRAQEAKAWGDRLAREGTLTMADVLLEEVFEAMAETNPIRLREELVQVAAVAVKWVQLIDHRRGRP